ncbi:MAG: asparagine synthase-related protein [Syntrophotaleaceae bacterium]
MQRRIRGFSIAGTAPRISQRGPLQRLRERIDSKQTEGRPLARKRPKIWIRNMLTVSADDSRRSGRLGILEERTPFLDHHHLRRRVVPDRFKIRDSVEKYVLREAFPGSSPKRFSPAEKWPYSAPPLFIEKGALRGAG